MRWKLIRVKVELDKGGFGTDIEPRGEIHIRNTGEGQGNYHTYEAKFLDRNGRVFRKARIENWPRERQSIWKLLERVMDTAAPIKRF